MKKILFLMLMLFLSLSSFAQSKKEKIVAKYYDQVITKKQLDDKLEKKYGKAVLQQMIQESILEKEIKKEKIKVSIEEVEKAFENIKKNVKEADFIMWLQINNMTIEDVKKTLKFNLQIEKLKEKKGKEFEKGIKITDEETQEYYNNNKEKFIEEEQIRCRHILVKTQEEAEDILKKIKNGENFEELAKKFSTCPSGKSGGDLGFFKRGTMAPEFEQVAFSLKIGEISSYVKTQFGYHIIKLEEKKEKKQFQFSEIKEKIKGEIIFLKKQSLLNQYFDDLIKKANIKIFL